MVHSKLISEGKVEPLTFQQLRKLERMDLKKEREAKILELAKVGLQGSADVLGRGLEGTVSGPIILALGLTALYPAWSRVVGAGAAAIAKDVHDAWFFGVVPHIPGAGGSAGTVPTPAPPSLGPKPADYSVWYMYKWSVLGGWQLVHYDSFAAADNDFEIWNALGICGNLWEARIIYTAEGSIWHPDVTSTVEKTSTLHSDVGPQIPR